MSAKVRRAGGGMLSHPAGALADVAAEIAVAVPSGGVGVLTGGVVALAAGSDSGRPTLAAARAFVASN